MVFNFWLAKNNLNEGIMQNELNTLKIKCLPYK